MTTNTLSLPSYSLLLRVDTRERGTWDEICAHFPDRWVVLVDIDWVNDTDFEFTAATLISTHERRRDASTEIKALRAQNTEVGCFWTGAIRAPSPRMFIP